MIIILISCKNKPLSFESESRFFFRLPVNADAYFKFDLKRINKVKTLHNLHRVKNIISFFKENGIDFIKETEIIYGALFFSAPEKNVFILKGDFNLEKMSRLLSPTHRKKSSEEAVYYESLDRKKWDLLLDIKGKEIVFSRGQRIHDEYDKSARIFHTLNVLKRVDFSAQGWLLLGMTQSVKNYLQNNIELELFAAASFYSFSYTIHPENNTLFFNIQIYVKRKELVNEIVGTVFSYYEKMVNTYSVIKKSFYHFRVYQKGNFTRINISVNLDNIILQ